MFIRVKKIGPYEYLYLVENAREGGRHVQRVIKALGRRDDVENSDLLDGLIASAARHFRGSIVLSSFYRGELPELRRLSIGPDLVLGRLWQETGCADVSTASWANGSSASMSSGPSTDGAASADGLRLGPPCPRLAPASAHPRCRDANPEAGLQGDGLARRGKRRHRRMNELIEGALPSPPAVVR